MAVTPPSLLLLLERAGFRDVLGHGRGNAVTVACAKVMALTLPALMPQRRRTAPAQVAGLATAPAVPALAAAGRASLTLGWAGEDRLGWTAIAVRT